MKKTLKIIALFLSIAYSAVPQACLSEGFESIPTGTTSSIPGWSFAAGTYTSSGNTGYCLDYPINTTVVPVVTVATTPYFLGASIIPSVVPNSPFAGSKIMRLHTSEVFNAGANFMRAEYTFTVTNSNKFFQYAFFARSFYDGHGTCCNNQYYKFTLVDCSNNAISCPSYTMGAPTSGSAICTTSGTNNLAYGTNNIHTPNWLIVTNDLTAYQNTCIKLVVELGMCAFGGHHQELFLDTKCLAMPVFASNGTSTANGNTLTVCNVPTTFLNMSATHSHTWVGPGGFGPSSSTLATTPVVGVYTVYIANPTCGPIITYTFMLQMGISPGLTVTPTSSVICQGGAVNLNMIASGATSYSWSNGATTQSIQVTPTVTTTYTAIASSSVGCETVKQVTIVVQNCTGILNQEKIQSSIYLFPNPSKGEVNIYGTKEDEVGIFDVSGKEIDRVKLVYQNNYHFTLTNLPAGIYFMRYGKEAKKFVIIN